MNQDALFHLVLTPDEARERRIQALQDVLDTTTDPETRRNAHDAMVAEIKARSPSQVARLERERGLA